MAPGGYAWWYVDAVSFDQRHALTIIAFVGSVFSPYYAWSGRREPINHCAINVAIYSPGAGRWAMTERSRKSVRFSESRLEIGRSSVDWDGTRLRIAIDERCAPLPRPLRGEVIVRPETISAWSTAIDGEGRHRWRPAAPRARVETRFSEPGLEWSGEGYFDLNEGDEPLEDAFTAWSWSRSHMAQGDAAILYDAVTRAGSRNSIALRMTRDGIERFEPPHFREAGKTGVWRMPRPIGCDDGASPSILRTFEDAPFYSRSLIESTLLGRRCVGVHESLSGDRLRSPLVKLMLPFRMPRADL